jgi:hypothetical protein
MTASGQKPEKADCRRFAPTKAVSHSQYNEWNTAKQRLININEPANANMILSIFMMTPYHFSSIIF